MRIVTLGGNYYLLPRVICATNVYDVGYLFIFGSNIEMMISHQSWSMSRIARE